MLTFGRMRGHPRDSSRRALAVPSESFIPRPHLCPTTTRRIADPLCILSVLTCATLASSRKPRRPALTKGSSKLGLRFAPGSRILPFTNRSVLNVYLPFCANCSARRRSRHPLALQSYGSACRSSLSEGRSRPRPSLISRYPLHICAHHFRLPGGPGGDNTRSLIRPRLGCAVCCPGPARATFTIGLPRAISGSVPT